MGAIVGLGRGGAIGPAGSPGGGSAPKTTQIFLPPAVSGLKFWFDTTDTNSYSLSGSKVTQWNDLSGNGYHATQGTDANRPTLTSSALNGRAVVTFASASSTSLTFSSAAIDVTKKHTYFFVCKQTAVSTGIVLFSVPGAGGIIQRYANDGSVQNWRVGGAWGGYSAADTQASAGSYSYYSVAEDRSSTVSGTIKIYSKGTLIGTSASGTNDATTDNVVIGGGVGGFYLTGAIAEIIGYEGLLSDADRQSVESYLAARYAL